MSDNEGFDAYYENSVLSAIQLEVGTTARGRDLIQKLHEMRIKADKWDRLQEYIAIGKLG